VVKRPAFRRTTRLGPKTNQQTLLTKEAFVQSLESLTLSVHALSCIRTDGHGNLISPKAGLKKVAWMITIDYTNVPYEFEGISSSTTFSGKLKLE
jgi:hypothetical protein